MAEAPLAQPALKAIIAFGLRSNSDFPEPVITQNVAQQKILAKEAGFEVETHFADPHDTSKAAADIKEAIKSRPQWDGVMIGFGMRGDPVLTPLFELAVNTCIEEVRPVPKFAFNVSPDSTVEALKRVFT
ncbi:hypothetical protein VMCG_07995 [Cytospora schulzeri]|uniref:Uncharacterized protein n=1 Tax=Cytospora schulzeri TaxID=448051 RepID=A0A423VY26_9PEZI|nr:hypothetical protein VMCG_07995 [Valsa malicola]